MTSEVYPGVSGVSGVSILLLATLATFPMAWLSMRGPDRTRGLRMLRRAEDQDTMGELFTKYYRLSDLLGWLFGLFLGLVITISRGF